jgi:Fur family ferric uptake transcriptional regulator
MIASTQTNHPLADTKVGASQAQAPLEQACARLKSSALRITQPRIAILTAMINRGQPTSIEQIHGDLEDGSCDLVTVYRCLAAFEEIGLVRRSFFLNGTSLYQINLGEQQRYHVVCKATNRVDEIQPEHGAELRTAIEKVEEQLRAQGYENVSHVVEFFGVAPTLSRVSEVVKTR